MKTQKQRRRVTPFTLIEVVVVIVILVTLASVATPMYMRYIKKAKISTAATQIKLIDDALQQYKLDVGTYPSDLQCLMENLDPCTHTAQLREVEILSSSRFRNSLLGTLSGSMNEPSALSIEGNTMQWNTMLSLPIKWIRRVSGSFHHVSQLPRSGCWSQYSLVLLM